MSEPNEQNLPKRFGEKRLFLSPEAVLKYEDLMKSIKGNRIFTSPNLAYYDREEDLVKAAILVSSEDESFIKKHRGILNLIDKGLRLMEHSLEPGTFKERNEVVLEEGIEIKRISRGGQSNVYLLTVDGEKYVIKTHIPRKIGSGDVRQPYINEMLQVQLLKRDLGNELEKLGVVLPTFLFASGQVVCVKFEEGERPEEHELINILPPLVEKIRNYIANQIRQGNSLFQNIDLDLVSDLERKIKVENFIKRPDGKFVLIDPFFYYDPEDQRFFDI